MAEDASLDDFVGSSGDDEEDEDEPPADAMATDAGNAVDAADATADETGDVVDGVEGAVGVESARVDSESVAPAVGTSRSVPDGASCPSCGESTTRLWAADDEAVCAACKSW